MTASAVLPSRTSVLLDRRNAGRALRITWHELDDAFVLSTWRGHVCASSFQLTRSDVPDLITALARGLADAPPARSPVRYAQPRHPFRRLIRRFAGRRAVPPVGLEPTLRPF